MTDDKSKKKKNLGRAARAGIVTAVVLGLLGLFNFAFPGLRNGSADGDSEAKTSLEEPSQDVESPTEPQSSEDDDTTPEPANLQPMQMVDVVIVGDEYWVGIGRKDGTIVRELRKMAEIISASKDVNGDASGVLVRVARTFNATAQAERALMSALKDAGLTEDQIDYRRTLTEFAPPKSS